MRNVGQIKQFAAEQLSESVTDTVLANSLLNRWINIARDRVVEDTFWNWNADWITLTWPAPASGEQTSVLYLPHFVGRLLPPFPNNLSYREPVEMLHPFEFDALRPGAGIGVGTDILVAWGYYGVELDNPSTGTITCTSSAAAAGNGVQVFLEGMDANQREIRETITLAGAGTATTTNSFRSGPGGIRRITLLGGTSATTGVITATRGATVIERLDSTFEQTHEHQRTELYSATSGAATYTLRYYRRHYLLALDGQVPEIPGEFHDLLEIGIMKWLRQFQGFAGEAAAFEGEFRMRLQDLKAWDHRSPGQKFQLRVAK